MNNTIAFNSNQLGDEKNLKNDTLGEKSVNTVGGIVFKKGRYSADGQKNDKDKQLTQK